MFTAYDKTIGRVVDAEEAKENGGKSHVYLCKNEGCRCTMILRAGEERTAHFAHHDASTPAQRACVVEEREGKSNELSEWTQRWSAKFPVDVRDGFVRHDGKYKKASALYEGSKTAVQLRHTRCLAKEFTGRSEHFASEGYRNVWVFDGSEWQAKEYIRKLSWAELSEEQRRVSKEKRQFHFEFSKHADFFGTYDPELDRNTLIYLTLFSEEDKELLYRMDWVRSDQARFSAIYTKETDFFADCAATKPLTEEELKSIRGRILAKREQRRKQYLEEQKRKSEEQAKEREERRKAFEAQAARERQEREERERQAAEEREKARLAAEEVRLRQAQELEERRARVKAELQRQLENLSKRDFENEQTPIMVGELRFVKCIYCGKIDQVDTFMSYGGIGTVNLGTCKACSRNPEVQKRIGERLQKEPGSKKRQSSGPPKCYKCGKPMVRKTNRRTGQEFWGCSDPACWKK